MTPNLVPRVKEGEELGFEFDATRGKFTIQYKNLKITNNESLKGKTVFPFLLLNT